MGLKVDGCRPRAGCYGEDRHRGWRHPHRANTARPGRVIHRAATEGGQRRVGRQATRFTGPSVFASSIAGSRRAAIRAALTWARRSVSGKTLRTTGRPGSLSATTTKGASPALPLRVPPVSSGPRRTASVSVRFHTASVGSACIGHSPCPSEYARRPSNVYRCSVLITSQPWPWSAPSRSSTRSKDVTSASAGRKRQRQ